MKLRETKNFQALLDHRQVAEYLWELVNIPSPTGSERTAALAYADMLSSVGAEVEVRGADDASPTVIGRVRGGNPGPVFQLAGHIDHVDLIHPPPSWTSEVITGRGAADMKGGLAGILGVVGALSRCGFPGELLITVYGLHEAPAGSSASLVELIKAGTIGSAALVAESASPKEDRVIVSGKGQAIWDLTVRRSGASTHELNRPTQADDLLPLVTVLLNTLLRYQQALVGNGDPEGMFDGESLFIGQLHLGDFYNRTATACTIQGTRRWLPNRCLSQVKKEFEEMLATVRLPYGIHLETCWTSVGDSFAVDPEEPVVRAFCDAYEQITGRRLKEGMTAAITDANLLIGLGRVPTVQCPSDNRTAHADHEFVHLEKIRLASEIMLQTLVNYFFSPES